MGFLSKITKPFRKVGKVIDKQVSGGLFTKVLEGADALINPEAPDLGGEEAKAFNAELARLRAVRAEETKTADFLARDGGGLAREGQFEFGDQFDLENLSSQDQSLRSSGRIKPAQTETDTGLIL